MARRSPMAVKVHAANIREAKRRDRLADENPEEIRARSRKRKFYIPERVAYRIALQAELMKRAAMHRKGVGPAAIAMREALLPLSEL